MANKQILDVPIGDVLRNDPDNAKTKLNNLDELRARIRQNGFDPAFPVQVTREPKGSKYKYRTVGGFTRHLAAELEDLTTIPIVICDYSPRQVQINHVTSNSGAPLTQLEQGRVYVKLRDMGTDPTALGVGEELREKPYSLAEIAAEVGYSTEHVRTCILIAESPKDIAALLESGKVSANAIIEVSKATKDLKVQREVLAAAIVNANGKIATDKHVKAVKDAIVPVVLRQSKAAKKTDDRSSSDPEKGDSESAPKPSAKTSAAPTETEGKPEAENGQSESGAGEKPAAGNSTDSRAEEYNADSQPSLIETNTSHQDDMTVIINRVCKERSIIMSDDDVDYMVKALTGSPF